MLMLTPHPFCIISWRSVSGTIVAEWGGHKQSHSDNQQYRGYPD